MPSIQTTIARELNLTAAQVAAVIDLVDQGNTIPFIARYRKEATGGIDDATLRDLDERLTYLRNLEARKDEVLRAIEEQGKLDGRPAREDRRGHGHAARRGPVQALSGRSAPPAPRRRATPGSSRSRC